MPAAIFRLIEFLCSNSLYCFEMKTLISVFYLEMVINNAKKTDQNGNFSTISFCHFFLTLIYTDCVTCNKLQKVHKDFACWKKIDKQTYLIINMTKFEVHKMIHWLNVDKILMWFSERSYLRFQLTHHQKIGDWRSNYLKQFQMNRNFQQKPDNSKYHWKSFEFTFKNSSNEQSKMP